MLKSELLEIIANGESSGAEFKRDDVRPEKLAKEIVAFANVRGGKLLLGVEDDGTISGLTRTDTERWVMDSVFGRCVHPQIIPFYEELTFDEEIRVAVITIESGTTKPYVLRQNDREEIYVRVGTTSRLASREQQARLFAAGAMLHAETMAVSGTSIADLHLERIENYLVEYARDDTAPPDELSRIKRLDGLGFMTPGPDGRHVCTIAGLVTFGRVPRRALPQAGVRWMAFESDDKEYQALDDVYIDGPLVPLMRRVQGSLEMLEPGLIDQIVERMTPWISTEDATVDSSMRRQRRNHFPPEALREALVNALVHRDWTRGLEVEVVSYRDRLEITSPGSLQNAMTIEKMLAGQRSPRNPILVDVCRDYGYVDARGMGVRRKIVPLVRQQSGSDAEFEATEDFLKVTLPRASVVREGG
ncbi:MAG: RNA-binding domain-containing protein [Nannocystaceae bacterium]